MKTPLELAAEHARTFVALRGQWVEPLTWEEVKVLLDEAVRPGSSIDYDAGYCNGYDDGFAKGQRAERQKAS